MPCGNFVAVMPIDVACPGHVAPFNRATASVNRLGQRRIFLPIIII
jgi:hypothetical protein